jgi:hypothetical protein
MPLEANPLFSGLVTPELGGNYLSIEYLLITDGK